MSMERGRTFPFCCRTQLPRLVGVEHRESARAELYPDECSAAARDEGRDLLKDRIRCGVDLRAAFGIVVCGNDDLEGASVHIVVAERPVEDDNIILCQRSLWNAQLFGNSLHQGFSKRPSSFRLFLSAVDVNDGHEFPPWV